MSASVPNIEHMALLKFGLAVPPQHREEVLKMIKTNPAYKDEFEQIKNSLSTMLNEDDFLEAITSSHVKIAEIPQNCKVIFKRENTFHIRAINPQHIQSLTERAFFNSFNLERVILNDQEDEFTRKKGDTVEREEVKVPERGEKVEKQIKKGDNDDEDKCICGKSIPDSYWIQCSNENKCRGSSWYHLQCAGVKGKPEDIAHMDFICEYCRRPQDDQKESQSSQKRFKQN